jgi:hypothetical protein|tara:strand:+ start:249 stop:506 length:258 start_codon:yes stop_codon:yes gene_type:complete
MASLRLYWWENDFLPSWRRISRRSGAVLRDNRKKYSEIGEREQLQGQYFSAFQLYQPTPELPKTCDMNIPLTTNRFGAGPMKLNG